LLLLLYMVHVDVAVDATFYTCGVFLTLYWLQVFDDFVVSYIY